MDQTLDPRAVAYARTAAQMPRLQPPLELTQSLPEFARPKGNFLQEANYWINNFLRPQQDTPIHSLAEGAGRFVGGLVSPQNQGFAENVGKEAVLGLPRAMAELIPVARAGSVGLRGLGAATSLSEAMPAIAQTLKMTGASGLEKLAGAAGLGSSFAGGYAPEKSVMGGLIQAGTTALAAPAMTGGRALMGPVTDALGLTKLVAQPGLEGPTIPRQVTQAVQNVRQAIDGVDAVPRSWAGAATRGVEALGSNLGAMADMELGIQAHSIASGQGPRPFDAQHAIELFGQQLPFVAMEALGKVPFSSTFKDSTGAKKVEFSQGVTSGAERSGMAISKQQAEATNLTKEIIASFETGRREAMTRLAAEKNPGVTINTDGLPMRPEMAKMYLDSVQSLHEHKNEPFAADQFIADNRLGTEDGAAILKTMQDKGYISPLKDGFFKVEKLAGAKDTELAWAMMDSVNPGWTERLVNEAIAKQQAQAIPEVKTSSATGASPAQSELGLPKWWSQSKKGKLSYPDRLKAAGYSEEEIAKLATPDNLPIATWIASWVDKIKGLKPDVDQLISLGTTTNKKGVRIAMGKALQLEAGKEFDPGAFFGRLGGLALDSINKEKAYLQHLEGLLNAKVSPPGATPEESLSALYPKAKPEQIEARAKKTQESLVGAEKTIERLSTNLRLWRASGGNAEAADALTTRERGMLKNAFDIVNAVHRLPKSIEQALRTGEDNALSLYHEWSTKESEGANEREAEEGGRRDVAELKLAVKKLKTPEEREEAIRTHAEEKMSSLGYSDEEVQRRSDELVGQEWVQKLINGGEKVEGDDLLRQQLQAKGMALEAIEKVFKDKEQLALYQAQQKTALPAEEKNQFLQWLASQKAAQMSEQTGVVPFPESVLRRIYEQAQPFDKDTNKAPYASIGKQEFATAANEVLQQMGETGMSLEEKRAFLDTTARGLAEVVRGDSATRQDNTHVLNQVRFADVAQKIAVEYTRFHFNPNQEMANSPELVQKQMREWGIDLSPEGLESLKEEIKKDSLGRDLAFHLGDRLEKAYVKMIKFAVGDDATVQARFLEDHKLKAEEFQKLFNNIQRNQVLTTDEAATQTARSKIKYFSYLTKALYEERQRNRTAMSSGGDLGKMLDAAERERVAEGMVGIAEAGKTIQAAWEKNPQIVVELANNMYEMMENMFQHEEEQVGLKFKGNDPETGIAEFSRKTTSSMDVALTTFAEQLSKLGLDKNEGLKPEAYPEGIVNKEQLSQYINGKVKSSVKVWNKFAEKSLVSLDDLIKVKGEDENPNPTEEQEVADDSKLGVTMDEVRGMEAAQASKIQENDALRTKLPAAAFEKYGHLTRAENKQHDSPQAKALYDWVRSTIIQMYEDKAALLRIPGEKVKLKYPDTSTVDKTIAILKAMTQGNLVIVREHGKELKLSYDPKKGAFGQDQTAFREDPLAKMPVYEQHVPEETQARYRLPADPKNQKQGAASFLNDLGSVARNTVVPWIEWISQDQKGKPGDPFASSEYALLKATLGSDAELNKIAPPKNYQEATTPQAWNELSPEKREALLNTPLPDRLKDRALYVSTFSYFFKSFRDTGHDAAESMGMAHAGTRIAMMFPHVSQVRIGESMSMPFYTRPAPGSMWAFLGSNKTLGQKASTQINLAHELFHAYQDMHRAGLLPEYVHKAMAQFNDYAAALRPEEREVVMHTVHDIVFPGKQYDAWKKLSVEYGAHGTLNGNPVRGAQGIDEFGSKYAEVWIAGVASADTATLAKIKEGVRFLPSQQAGIVKGLFVPIHEILGTLLKKVDAENPLNVAENAKDALVGLHDAMSQMFPALHDIEIAKQRIGYLMSSIDPADWARYGLRGVQLEARDPMAATMRQAPPLQAGEEGNVLGDRLSTFFRGSNNGELEKVLGIKVSEFERFFNLYGVEKEAHPELTKAFNATAGYREKGSQLSTEALTPFLLKTKRGRLEIDEEGTGLRLVGKSPKVRKVYNEIQRAKNELKQSDGLPTKLFSDDEMSAKMSGLSPTEQEAVINMTRATESMMVKLHDCLLKGAREGTDQHATAMVMKDNATLTSEAAEQIAKGLAQSVEKAKGDPMTALQLLGPAGASLLGGEQRALSYITRLAPEFEGLARLAKTLDHPEAYTPEVRVGRYQVQWMRNGKSVGRIGTDSEQEMLKVHNEMTKQGFEVKSFDTDVRTPLEAFLKADSFYALRDLENTRYQSMLKLLEGGTDKETAEWVRAHYSPLEAMEGAINQGNMKAHLMKRSLSEGRETVDTFSGIFDYMTKVTTGMAKTYARGEFLKAMLDPALREQPYLKQYARQQFEHTVNPPTAEWTAFKNANFLMKLGMNLSSIAVSATHNGVTFVPWLTMQVHDMRARTGGSGAIQNPVAHGFKLLAEAVPSALMHMVKGKFGGELGGEMSTALDIAIKKGLGDLGFMQEFHRLEDDAILSLRSMSNGDNSWSSVADQALSPYRWAVKTARSVYGVAPQFNTRVAFYGAFKAATQMGLSGAERQAFAERVLTGTQFAGGLVQRPVGALEMAGRGELYGAVGASYSLMFYTYGVLGLFAHFAKTALKDVSPERRLGAQKAAGVMLATQFGLAGAMGLPVAAGVAKMIDELFPAAQLERRTREGITDMAHWAFGHGEAGTWVGNAAVHGLVNEATGFDLASRMHMGMMPGLGEGGVTPESLLGTLTSLTGQATRAIQQGGQGYYWNALRTAAPNFLKPFIDLSYGKGDFRDSKYNLMYNGTTAEKVGYLAGFKPTALSKLREMSEMDRDINQVDANQQSLFHMQMAQKLMETMRPGGTMTPEQKIQIGQEIKQQLIARQQANPMYSAVRGAQEVADRAVDMLVPKDPSRYGLRAGAMERGELARSFGSAPAPTEMQRLQMSTGAMRNMGVMVPIQPSRIKRASLMDWYTEQNPFASRGQIEAAVQALHGPTRRGMGYPFQPAGTFLPGQE